MKTLFFILFPVLLFAQDQDTICLSKDRLGRIADSLAYYRMRSELATELDSSFRFCMVENSNLRQININNEQQLSLCSQAVAIERETSNTWKTTAEQYKKEYDAQVPKLARARKARRGWMIAAIAEAAAITGAVIAIIKK
jgi:hypothetical protein